MSETQVPPVLPTAKKRFSINPKVEIILGTVLMTAAATAFTIFKVQENLSKRDDDVEASVRSELPQS